MAAISFFSSAVNRIDSVTFLFLFAIVYHLFSVFVVGPGYCPEVMCSADSRTLCLPSSSRAVLAENAKGLASSCSPSSSRAVLAENAKGLASSCSCRRSSSPQKAGAFWGPQIMLLITTHSNWLKNFSLKEAYSFTGRKKKYLFTFCRVSSAENCNFCYSETKVKASSAF